MYHFILLLVCIIFLEILFLFKFFSILISYFKVMRNVSHIIAKKNISDHWKERVIPAYSLVMIKYSLQILLILLVTLSLFFIAENLFHDFLNHTLSLTGVLETIFFTIGYIYFRKLLVK